MSHVSTAVFEVSKEQLWSKFNEKKIGSCFTSVSSVFINSSAARTNSSAHNVLYVSWSAERMPRISKAQVCAKRASRRQTLSDTHLEFHLLSLLGVDSHNVLVMPECVSAVLLLCSHVSLQSLQHALRLEDKSWREDRVRKCQTVRLKGWFDLFAVGLCEVLIHFSALQTESYDGVLGPHWEK